MNRLRELREDCDLLQKDLANSLGITQRHYSYFETGQTVLTAEILIKIADFYNISIDYLLYRTDERSKYPTSIMKETTKIIATPKKKRRNKEICKEKVAS